MAPPGPPPIRRPPPPGRKRRKRAARDSCSGVCWGLGGGTAALVAAVGVAYHALAHGFGGGLVGTFFFAAEEAAPDPTVPADPERYPLLGELEQFQGGYAHDLHWGSYRPGHFIGMRERKPAGLLAGGMWFSDRATHTNGLLNIRHQADWVRDIRNFGWHRHDGRTSGRQEIHDGRLNFTHQFLKDTSGGKQDWAIRFEGRRAYDHLTDSPGISADGPDTSADGPDTLSGLSDTSPIWVSFFFYIAHEVVPEPNGTRGWTFKVDLGPSGNKWEPWQGRDMRGGAGPGGGRGVTHLMDGGIDNFQLSCAAVNSSLPVPRVSFLGTTVGDVKDADRLVRTELLKQNKRRAQRVKQGATQTGLPLRLSNTRPKEPARMNFAVFQVDFEVRPDGTELYCRSPDDPESCYPTNEPGQMLWRGVDFVFTSGGDPKTWDDRARALSGAALTRKLAAKEDEFNERFATTFPTVKAFPHVDPDHNAFEHKVFKEDPDDKWEVVEEMNKFALSNLLGGIGYFYGQSRVSTVSAGPADEYELYFPARLFTGVPSRPFFPRGFLWDEGFHQLIVWRWDKQLSRDMLGSWFDLLNSQGWIPREQILGAEARSRVPDEFVIQRTTNANPPALFLPLQKMAEEIAGLSEEQRRADPTAHFLEAAFPRLELWLDWYLKSQRGPVPGSFRWRGRDPNALNELNPKTLTSGLDDYPRASHPTEDERHVDLLCWMVLGAQTLETISAALHLEAAPKYSRLAAELGSFERLNALHLEASTGRYLDWGLHTEKVALGRAVNEAGEGVIQRLVFAEPELQYVPHFGYVSVFPFAMGLIDRDSNLLHRNIARILEELACGNGLRSLSRKSSLYGKDNTPMDKPYWRFSVWININYLVLAAAKKYLATGPWPDVPNREELHQMGLAWSSIDEGGYYPEVQDQSKEAGIGSLSTEKQNRVLLETLWSKVRYEILRNMQKKFHEGGSIWEQYTDGRGDGRGTRPFAGWSALSILIAADMF